LPPGPGLWVQKVGTNFSDAFSMQLFKWLPFSKIDSSAHDSWARYLVWWLLLASKFLVGSLPPTPTPDFKLLKIISIGSRKEDKGSFIFGIAICGN